MSKKKIRTELSKRQCDEFRKRREAMGLSQAELAERIGCSQGAISALECGQVSGRYSRTHIDAAIVLGMGLAELTPVETRLLSAYRGMGEEGRAKLWRLVRKLA